MGLFILGTFVYCGIAGKVMFDDDRLDCGADPSFLACLYVVFRAYLWPLIPVARLLESPVLLLGPGEEVP